MPSLTGLARQRSWKSRLGSRLSSTTRQAPDPTISFRLPVKTNSGQYLPARIWLNSPRTIPQFYLAGHQAHSFASRASKNRVSKSWKTVQI